MWLSFKDHEGFDAVSSFSAVENATLLHSVLHSEYVGVFFAELFEKLVTQSAHPSEF